MLGNNDKFKAALPYLGLAATSLFWAGNALIARGFNASVEPVTLAFLRWSLCGILISPFIFRALLRHWETVRRLLGKILLLAFLSVTSYNSLLYISAHNTTALNITLVNALMPVTTVVLTLPILGQHLTTKSLLGIGLAFLGALWVILRGDVGQLISLSINKGDAVMALAMLFWSLYSILLRRWMIPIPGFDLFAIFVGLGVLMLLPFYCWERTVSAPIEWTSPLVMAIVYVAIFPSLCAYLLWNYGIKKTSPSTAALFAYLTPLITAMLAIPLLQETPQWFHFWGGLAILAGLYLSQDLAKPGPPPLQQVRQTSKT